jgi:hypothetical protein
MDLEHIGQEHPSRPFVMNALLQISAMRFSPMRLRNTPNPMARPLQASQNQETPLASALETKA